MDVTLHNSPMRVFSALSRIDVLWSGPRKLNLFFRNSEPTTFRHDWLVTKGSTVFTSIEISVLHSCVEPDGAKLFKNESWGSSHS